MANQDQDEDGVAVPRGRISRFARLGAVAAGVGMDVIGGGLRAAASGERVDMQALALTPRNASRLASELARMRGAAMKVGQLLSMDAGDLLPEEFAAILARLRADAHPMPPRQLKRVLEASWGKAWLKRFAHFDPRPLAAASIGQVHRAKTRDGRDLAIKVQFPGVRDSIIADVDNVGGLIRLSGLMPKGLDLAPLLEEAKRQLAEEADYHAEARALAHFHAVLKDAPDFRTPAPHEDLSTRDVLAMDFIASAPIETLETADQAMRDQAATRLFSLLFREVFELRRIQSDPNPANYRVERETGRLVLLDFGATRLLPEPLIARYRDLLKAGAGADAEGLAAAARAIGYLTGDTPTAQADLLITLLNAACEPLRAREAFDFGGSDLLVRLRDEGMRLGLEEGYREVPPMDALYLHRKFGGLYLLARRLRARVDIRGLAAPYLDLAE